MLSRSSYNGPIGYPQKRKEAAIASRNSGSASELEFGIETRHSYPKMNNPNQEQQHEIFVKLFDTTLRKVVAIELGGENNANQWQKVEELYKTVKRFYVEQRLGGKFDFGPKMWKTYTNYDSFLEFLEGEQQKLDELRSDPQNQNMTLNNNNANESTSSSKRNSSSNIPVYEFRYKNTIIKPSTHIEDYSSQQEYNDAEKEFSEIVSALKNSKKNRSSSGPGCKNGAIEVRLAFNNINNSDTNSNGNPTTMAHGPDRHRLSAAQKSKKKSQQQQQNRLVRASAATAEAYNNDDDDDEFADVETRGYNNSISNQQQQNQQMVGPKRRTGSDYQSLVMKSRQQHFRTPNHGNTVSGESSFKDVNGDTTTGDRGGESAISVVSRGGHYKFDLNKNNNNLNNINNNMNEVFNSPLKQPQQLQSFVSFNASSQSSDNSNSNNSLNLNGVAASNVTGTSNVTNVTGVSNMSYNIQNLNNTSNTQQSDSQSDSSRNVNLNLSNQNFNMQELLSDLNVLRLTQQLEDGVSNSGSPRGSPTGKSGSPKAMFNANKQSLQQQSSSQSQGSQQSQNSNISKNSILNKPNQAKILSRERLKEQAELLRMIGSEYSPSLSPLSMPRSPVSPYQTNLGNSPLTMLSNLTTPPSPLGGKSSQFMLNNTNSTNKNRETQQDHDNRNSSSDLIQKGKQSQTQQKGSQKGGKSKSGKGSKGSNAKEQAAASEQSPKNDISKNQQSETPLLSLPRPIPHIFGSSGSGDDPESSNLRASDINKSSIRESNYILPNRAPGVKQNRNMKQQQQQQLEQQQQAQQDSFEVNNWNQMNNMNYQDIITGGPGQFGSNNTTGANLNSNFSEQMQNQNQHLINHLTSVLENLQNQNKQATNMAQYDAAAAMMNAAAAAGVTDPNLYMNTQMNLQNQMAQLYGTDANGAAAYNQFGGGLDQQQYGAYNNYNSAGGPGSSGTLNSYGSNTGGPGGGGQGLNSQNSFGYNNNQYNQGFGGYGNYSVGNMGLGATQNEVKTGGGQISGFASYNKTKQIDADKLVPQDFVSWFLTDPVNIIQQWFQFYSVDASAKSRFNDLSIKRQMVVMRRFNPSWSIPESDYNKVLMKYLRNVKDEPDEVMDILVPDAFFGNYPIPQGNFAQQYMQNMQQSRKGQQWNNNNQQNQNQQNQHQNQQNNNYQNQQNNNFQNQQHQNQQNPNHNKGKGANNINSSSSRSDGTGPGSGKSNVTNESNQGSNQGNKNNKKSGNSNSTESPSEAKEPPGLTKKAKKKMMKKQQQKEAQEGESPKKGADMEDWRQGMGNMD